DHVAASKGALASCDRVAASARGLVGNDKLPPPPGALVAACAAATRLGTAIARAAAKAFFETHFTPNAIVHDGARGLLTGYYEPLLDGSRTPQGIFQTPIYKRPPDLVNLVDETQRASAGMGLTHPPKPANGPHPFP